MAQKTASHVRPDMPIARLKPINRHRRGRRCGALVFSSIRSSLTEPRLILASPGFMYWNIRLIGEDCKRAGGDIGVSDGNAICDRAYSKWLKIALLACQAFLVKKILLVRGLRHIEKFRGILCTAYTYAFLMNGSRTQSEF
jgi:hypothetical protein